jgi:phosphotriesterase-related protein
MNCFSRKEFLLAGLGLLFLGAKKSDATVMTVRGAIAPRKLGMSLVHEHFLVDFIGADSTSLDRWDRQEVLEKVLPYILEAKQAGVKTMFDCTPSFLGRDAILLQMLSEQSGMQIVTNTGYYGAVGNKYLPPWAFTETAEQLSGRWVKEFENGIQDTSVKPGFIKISVDADGPLSEVHQKLVKAAAITHLKTGLTIFSHTGPGKTAFEELNIIQDAGVGPSAFVWVHAQNEADKTFYFRAADTGMWVSLDGIGWGNIDRYADAIAELKNKGLLHRTLISHDAGWYKPDEPEAEFKGFTRIFEELLPKLEKKGFSTNDFDQLLIANPAEAMHIRVRKR